MSNELNERSIPEAALRDKNSVEMLRVWIAEKKLHCSLKIGMYKEKFKVSEEDAWGVILADVARHISNALREGYDEDEKVIITKIINSFLKELGEPTSNVSGEFIDKT